MWEGRPESREGEEVGQREDKEEKGGKKGGIFSLRGPQAKKPLVPGPLCLIPRGLDQSRSSSEKCMILKRQNSLSPRL